MPSVVEGVNNCGTGTQQVLTRAMEQANYNYRQNPYTLITALYKNSNWKNNSSKQPVWIHDIKPKAGLKNMVWVFFLRSIGERKNTVESTHTCMHACTFTSVCAHTHTPLQLIFKPYLRQDCPYLTYDFLGERELMKKGIDTRYWHGIAARREGQLPLMVSIPSRSTTVQGRLAPKRSWTTQTEPSGRRRRRWWPEVW